MRWWVRLNGHTEGPFSEVDIRKRISLNMIGSLDRVSADGRSWKYLKDTELWRPSTSSSAPSPMPVVLPDASSPSPPLSARPMSAEMPQVPIPERLKMPQVEVSTHKTNRALILGICGGMAAMLLVSFCVAVIVMAGRNHGAEKSDTTSGFAAVKDKIALIKCREGSGTGFLLGMDGKTYLVSNEHVVRSVGEIEARLIDGTSLQLGEFSVASDGRDLARFEVLNGPYSPLTLRESLPNVNEQVTVYGNSLGGGVATESKGFIQGVGPKRIETNAEIVSGNSGSPLIDSDGKVVGVAAFIVGGHLVNDKDRFFNRDTRYADHVRRFAVRLAEVDWKILKRSEYEAQVRNLEEFKLYFEHLAPFLLFDSCKIDDAKLVYNDLDSKGFHSDEAGFDEMLKGVARTYEKMGKSCVRWVEHDKERQGLIQRLNAAIAAKEISKADAEKKLVQFDNNNKTGQAYEKMKEALRAMILVRKEALNHASAFLDGRTWSAPQLANGYDGDIRESVADYRKGCKEFLDLMNQKLKDLNKGIKDFEQGDDDDDEN